MKRILISLALLSTVFISHALTLAEARNLAMEKYPLVHEYNLIALSEQYTVDNAAKAWLPQVGVGTNASWQSAVAAYPDVLKEMLEQRGLDMKGMSRWQWKASVDVEQMIWDGGRVKASQEIAGREAEIDRISDEVEIYQLQKRIDEIYFGILLLGEQQKALASTIDLLRANLDKVNALVRNGAAMQSDADAIEAELLLAGQQSISVEASQRAYRSILEIYIGEKAHEIIEIPEVPAIPGTNDCADRPEQKLMDARKSLLLAKQQQIKSDSRPRIGAFIQGYFGYPGLNFMEAMMSRNPTFNAMAGVSISWNLGSLYTRKNKLLSLETASERIDVARNVFDLNTEIQATGQRGEIEKLYELTKSDKAIVELRQRVRNASEARLREGIVEPTDLLLRITDEKNAVISANTHHIQYLKAIYQLQNTLNCN